MPQSATASPPDRPLRRTAPWGIQVGKLDGTGVDGRLRSRALPPARPRAPLAGSPDLSQLLSAPFTGGGRPLGRPAGPREGPRTRRPSRARKIVTWLILPVVICLSQRLSHACLSISNYTVKLRMAH